MDLTCAAKEPKKKSNLSAVQLKRIERNRQKAVLLRKSRVATKPNAESVITQKGVSRPRDTGGGFLLDDAVEESTVESRPVVYAPAPLASVDRPICEECNEEFNDSFLHSRYNHFVCDNCRDSDGVHCLISKTDAKKEYLLKDCDLDKREPSLKFILKKNPHNMHGNMKLYLRLQVEKRALEVWGSEEQLEEVRDQKEEEQVKRKQKAFDKKIKALRMAVRSSLYRKTSTSHEHTYGPESYNEDEDMYEKTCTICGHKLQYEKM